MNYFYGYLTFAGSAPPIEKKTCEKCLLVPIVVISHKRYKVEALGYTARTVYKLLNLQLSILFTKK
jgi:hypothetical protein